MNTPWCDDIGHKHSGPEKLCRKEEIRFGRRNRGEKHRRKEWSGYLAVERSEETRAENKTCERTDVIE